jgi:flagellar biosynthesis protein FlhF
MQIKTFKAPTINEALQLVKKELGAEAVILKNERINRSPTESYIEIVAAMDDKPAAAGRVESPDRVSPEVHDDIKEIKSLLSMLVGSKDYFTKLQIEQPLTEVYHHLLMKGLEEKQTFILLKKALSELAEGPVRKQDIMKSFLRQLLIRISLANPFQNLAAAPSAVFTFVGPTGVGKTTTLAKLAAYLKIKRRLEVAVISVDTYRIGAINQLQQYAEILEVPFQAAQNGSDIAKARERFQHQDVVLVDTIGKNYLLREQVSDLQEVFEDEENLQHLLVLSATAKDEDLRQTIRQFQSLPIHSLIFTKVDETLSFGNVINQLVRFDYPLSFLGTGQRVPEDIKLANRKNLLSSLWRGDKQGEDENHHGS